MNDTILNTRQKQILQFVETGEGIARLEIKERLPGENKASIPTISRDLNFLLENKFIKVAGKGPATRYFPFNTHPLLKYFDLDGYFALDPDKRLGAKKVFNLEIFTDLKNLFSLSEIKALGDIAKSFSQKSKNLKPDIFRRELERFTIELSWKSSEIEGNTYSLLDTEALIKQQIEAPGHSKEEAIMILNHKKTFESILENSQDYKEIAFSKLSQLHNFMVKGLNINTGIRDQAVGIIGTVYRPLANKWRIREVVNELLQTVNKTVHPLEKTLIILAMVSYIQPFADGNKRTARMLANAVLIANDCYPLSYRSVSETFYKKALVLFYEQNSLSYLKQIIVDQYKFALETYFK